MVDGLARGWVLGGFDSWDSAIASGNDESRVHVYEIDLLFCHRLFRPYA